MKELLAKLELDANLSGEDLLERLKEGQEKVLEQLVRRRDAELVRELAAAEKYYSAKGLHGTVPCSPFIMQFSRKERHGVQSFSRQEIAWAAREMSDKAGLLERTDGTADATDIERGLSRLRAEQFRSIAERFAKAAADGDKRIAVR